VIWGGDGWREENASKQELSLGSDFITTENAQHAFEHAGPARQRTDTALGRQVWGDNLDENHSA